jgi:hypothetical protein
VGDHPTQGACKRAPLGEDFPHPAAQRPAALVRRLTMDEVRAILDAPNLTTRLGIAARPPKHYRS